MTEREQQAGTRRRAGARIYDTADQADETLRKPIAADDTARDPAEPRNDPNLGNILTIIIVAALVLALVFGLVILSQVL